MYNTNQFVLQESVVLLGGCLTVTIIGNYQKMIHILNCPRETVGCMILHLFFFSATGHLGNLKGEINVYCIQLMSYIKIFMTEILPGLIKCHKGEN